MPSSTFLFVKVNAAAVLSAFRCAYTMDDDIGFPAFARLTKYAQPRPICFLSTTTQRL